jgi:putative hydrolase of the HAD superfamily
MNIKAIGFDLGETLYFNNGIGLNWKEHYIPAIQCSLNKLKINPSEAQLSKSSEILEEYNTRIHPRVNEIDCDDIFKRIVSEASLPDIIDLQVFEDEFFAYFSKNKQEFYDDALKTLSKLKELNYGIGFLTDVPYGQKRPSDENSHSIFEKLISISPIYISSVDVGFRKPAINGFLELANRLKCNTDEVMYVGNEEKDIIGSKKAGMVACLISRDNQIKDWGQDITIHSLCEIFTI